MSHVHRINGYDRDTYAATRRNAESILRNGGAESIDCVDAADECNRLARECDRLEAELDRVRYILSQLVDELHPAFVAEYSAARTAAEYVKAHPPAPATAADRDGGRSYGGG